MAKAKGTCSIDECSKPAVKRGWCNLHYLRWRRHGDPAGAPPDLLRDRVCVVPACDKPAKKRGWCNAHYLRWHRHGNPLAGNTARGSPNLYLEATVLPYDGDNCLIWPFARNTHGYGRIWNCGQVRHVSRVVCAHIHGPAPSAKLDAAHSCGMGHKGCCTPRHLSWKTRKDNVADTLPHGTRNRGARHGKAKLSENDVRQIRSLSGQVFQRDIARQFNVSVSCVQQIIRRINWAWLD